MKKLFFILVLLLFTPLSLAQASLYKSVVTTNYGMVLGELDKRSWLDPINALYLSRDLGESWEILGLQDRGINKIKFYENKLYATTYYNKDNIKGLFISEDIGNTWTNIGPQISTTLFDRDQQTLYLGSTDHGLWISQDDGQTWNQKLEDEIKQVFSTPTTTFIVTIDKFFKTTDHGNTFMEIPDFDAKSFYSFASKNNHVFTGSEYYEGIFYSSAFGNNWDKIADFSTNSLLYFDKTLFAGKNDYINGIYTLEYTNNLGQTWNTLATFNKKIIDIAVAQAEKNYLFVIVLNTGVYKIEIPDTPVEEFNFLAIPFETDNTNNLIDTISAYFDHTYPLLGYSYYSEPAEESDTTTNFFGENDSAPDLYYSSHSGTDFSLPYGTVVKAAAGGTAYPYYCTDCGNSVKIDHPQGYTTVYMHLQNEDLLTQAKHVEQGEQIGKIGMTGRTTGPHLHFEVQQTSKNFPEKRVDPFGWLSTTNADPWSVFTWTDIFGSHIGSVSKYLWNILISTFKKTEFIENTKNIESQNKVVNVNPNISESNFTFEIISYLKPEPIEGLNYVPNTSMKLFAKDLLGNFLSSLDNSVQIQIDLSNSDLTNLNLSTIKLYLFNEKLNIWEVLTSSFDSETKILTAETTHLSRFAAFGEPIDSEIPQTSINISDFDEITLSCNKPNCTIHYSIDNDQTWEIYTMPFVVTENVFTNILYRGIDEKGNLEPTNSYVVTNNSSEKMTDKLKITNANFSVNLSQ